MIARRASAFLLSLVLVSPVAAQVRAIPVEAGTAPLTGLPSGAQASSFAPALSVMPLAASLSGTPVVAAPSAPAALAQSVGASAASSFAPAAGVEAAGAAAAKPAKAASPSAPALAADAPVAASRDGALLSPRRGELQSARGPRAQKDASRDKAFADAPAAAPEDLDALFDGDAAHRTFAAPSDGPAIAPKTAAAAALPAPSRRLLSRAGKFLNVAIPVAAVGGIALGAFSPHLALTALHALGQASYWIANPLAFMFTVPQIHRILSRRSAEVSTSMTAIGLFSALVTTLCFAFDGKDLMMYRNLAQTAGFAAMLGLEAKYARSKGGKAPSRTRALIETGVIVLALAAILAFAGPILMAAIPGIALMSSLLVPFQILSGFGFTYMMYAQLRKMNVEHSAGDASAGMMWAYLGTKVIWLWSFATMLSLVAAPAWLTLAAGAAFAGICWLATRYALSRLLDAPWTFLPEKLVFRGRTLTRRMMGDAAAFVALAALILVLSAIGHIAFASLLGIAAGAGPLFAMYLLYTVQNLVAAMATSKTLRLQARFGQEAPNLRP